jgi:two-component system sensor histidine kinase/response regulator
VDAHLTKPVTPSSLLDAIMTATTEPAFETAFSGATVPGHEEEPEPVKILLAEDNPVNQVLITRLLEKKNCPVTVAANGKEVLEALKENEFDLILMDVQMPMMDGFETTRSIRRKEKFTKDHINIIAMTAHAMQGDKERCLEVGMDDYLSKPVKSEELYNTINKFATAEKEKENRQEPDKQEPDGSAVDIPKALDAVGGHREILVELIEMFMKDYPERLDSLRKAVSEKDSDGIKRDAHKLKGNLGQVMADQGFNLAKDLEQSVNEESLNNAQGLLTRLEGEIERVSVELSSFLRSVEKEKV